MGSLREQSLAELWMAQAGQKPVAALEDLWGFCKSCPHAARCRAGCTWTTHVLFGRRGNNPYCHFRALTLAERGIAEVLEPVSPAPGEPFDHGRWHLAERPLAPTLARDPVRERTLATHVFGLHPNATSAWNPNELNAALI